MKKTFIGAVILFCSTILEVGINYNVTKFALEEKSFTLTPWGDFYSVAADRDVGLLYVMPKLLIIIGLVILAREFFKRE